MTFDQLPKDLDVAIQKVYKPAGLKITSEAKRETESSEYGACRFDINGHKVVFRIAKTTPTKIGQFVTIWKRPVVGGVIVPLDASDNVAFVIVSVCDDKNRGQFVFDQKLLITKDIMSFNGRGGKLAIRIYPPWTKPIAKMAIKTQQWQLPYFFSISEDGVAESSQVRKLLGT